MNKKKLSTLVIVMSFLLAGFALYMNADLVQTGAVLGVILGAVFTYLKTSK